MPITADPHDRSNTIPISYHSPIPEPNGYFIYPFYSKVRGDSDEDLTSFDLGQPSEKTSNSVVLERCVSSWLSFGYPRVVYVWVHVYACCNLDSDNSCNYERFVTCSSTFPI